MSVSESSSLMLKRGAGKTKHDKLSIGLIFSALITFIVTAGFNALAGSGAGVPQVFQSTTGDISAKYSLYITPAGFTFSIWSVIYLWIAATLVTLVVTIFINTSQGKLYLNPPFATPLLTGIMSVNFILNLAWIFIWDREYVVAAAVVLFILAVSGLIVTGLMARNIEMYREEYSRGGDSFAWGVVYRLMMNGFALYTTWCIIAFLINLTHALVYAADTDMKATCLASLSLLVIFHVTWFILENFVLDKYVRYLLTPYLVVIWASNGIRAKLADPINAAVPDQIPSYVLAILIIASITLVVRIGIVVFRIIRKPFSRVGTLHVMH